jgi:1-acyl-sn-glycerol-3-phosphate acyltransferase
MAWRDQHVAHRVDRRRETVEIGAILDFGHRRLKRLHVRVAPVLGPEDEADDLVQRFESHVKALRDLLWEERIPSLEQKVIDAYADRVEDMLASAAPLTTATGFAIDIDPSGRT